MLNLYVCIYICQKILHNEDQVTFYRQKVSCKKMTGNKPPKHDYIHFVKENFCP